MRISMDVPDEDVWSAVFGSEFQQYPWWYDVQFLEDAAWDKPGLVTLTIDDPECPEGSGMTVTETIGISLLSRAIDDCIRHGLVHSDWENWDADSGDAILQYALLRDVVYG